MKSQILKKLNDAYDLIHSIEAEDIESKVDFDFVGDKSMLLFMITQYWGSVKEFMVDDPPKKEPQFDDADVSNWKWHNPEGIPDGD